MSWYYAQANEPKGPIPEPEFLQLVAQGVITPSTLVWREGMPQWTPWSQVSQGAGVSPEVPAATPLEGAPVTDETGAPAAAASGLMACVACQQFFPVEDLVELGGRKVCAACKPIYLQRLQEGAVGWSTFGTAETDTAAHGSLTEEELIQRDYDVPVVDLFGSGVRLMRDEPATVLLGGALTHIVISAASWVPYLGAIVSLIFTGPLRGGLQLAYLGRLRSGRMAVPDVFCGFGPRFGTLLLAHLIPILLAGLCIAVPIGFIGAGAMVVGNTAQGGGTPETLTIAVAGVLMLAGVIASTYLTVSWFYVMPLVADRHYGVLQAMALSRKIVGRHFWQHVWMLIFSGIVGLIGLLLCFVGLLAAMPLISLANTLLYERVFHGLATQRSN